MTHSSPRAPRLSSTGARLGFGDPQNRTEKAVERTAPVALFVYGLTVAWYLLVGTQRQARRWLPRLGTRRPSPLCDMLAALRRETWRTRLLDPLRGDHRRQKSIAPLLRAVGNGG